MVFPPAVSPYSPTHTLVFVVLVLTVTTPNDPTMTWSISVPDRLTGIACRTCQPFWVAHRFSLRPTCRSPLAPMAKDSASVRIPNVLAAVTMNGCLARSSAARARAAAPGLLLARSCHSGPAELFMGGSGLEEEKFPPGYGNLVAGDHHEARPGIANDVCRPRTPRSPGCRECSARPSPSTYR